MKLIDLKDLTPRQLKANPESKELTPEEKAEVVALATAGMSVEGLDQPEMWAPATPMEDLLRELEDAQQRWDEQHP